MRSCKICGNLPHFLTEIECCGHGDYSKVGFLRCHCGLKIFYNSDIRYPKTEEYVRRSLSEIWNVLMS